MITAEFFSDGKEYSGFCVKGHAKFADNGYDIVCAAVSSAVMLTVNTLTEVFGILVVVKVGEDSVKIKDCRDINGKKIIHGLRLHLLEIERDYPEAVRVLPGI